MSKKLEDVARLIAVRAYEGAGFNESTAVKFVGYHGPAPRDLEIAAEVAQLVAPELLEAERDPDQLELTETVSEYLLGRAVQVGYPLE